MAHSIEFPNPELYVLICNDTGGCGYTFVNTTQVFDTAEPFETFTSWTGLYEYAMEHGYNVPEQNPL